MSSLPTRRSFLKQSAALSAFGFPGLLRAANANSKLQVAVIGVDGMGFSDIKSTGDHPAVRFVGFCDIDSTRFAKADADYPGVPHFADYRAMLSQLGDQVDAVIVATPDHSHAPAAMLAMRLGKHVYCQKPLTHTVWEARQMRLLAEKKGVITQMGNQIHSNIEYRLGTRLIKEGAIGKIKEVHSWVGVTGNERTKLLEPPTTGASVPDHVNWDLWIGPAPMRDYAPVYHPFVWRDWQDFGGGALGDFGCHILDPVFTALGLNAPLTVEARNSGINRHIWPTSQRIEYVFPGNDLIAGDTLKVTWTDGGLRPERKTAKMPPELDLPKSGSLFIGTEGNLVLAHVAGPRLYPVEKFQGFSYPKEESFNHRHVWVEACLAGKPTSDGFHYAGPLSETVQLGNVATRLAMGGEIDRRTGAPVLSTLIEWDSAGFRIPNRPEAEPLLSKTYRPGWEIEPA